MGHIHGDYAIIAQRLDEMERSLKREIHAMANQIDTLIQALNDNTNAVATRLDKLIADASANKLPDGSVVFTADQVASVQAVSDHLKQLGADASNPVPPAFPAGSADAQAAPPAASAQGPAVHTATPGQVIAPTAPVDPSAPTS